MASDPLTSLAPVSVKLLVKTLETAVLPILKRLQQRIEKLEQGAGSNARAVDLETRIRALEDRPTMKYEGVWLENKTYPAGSVVTNGGSMWHANISTRSEPGAGHSRDWTLCVKRGREGRRV